MNNENVIRIALIDDHDMLRDAIASYLESFGFHISFQAENGKDALQKMAESIFLPDVCIVDLNMPVMNGFETAKALISKYPNVKILAFSVNDDEESITGMIQSGAHGYILKGADPDEIKKAVDILYRNGKYFSVGVYNIIRSYFKDISRSDD